MAEKMLACLATCWATLIPAAAWAAGSAPVPAGYLGTWAAHGACSSQKERLVITPRTAALGATPSAPVVYVPNDDGAGHGALHWAREYETDNFVLARPIGPLVHNAQGYGMPGQVAYTKCPR